MEWCFPPHHRASCGDRQRLIQNTTNHVDFTNVVTSTTLPSPSLSHSPVTDHPHLHIHLPLKPTSRLTIPVTLLYLSYVTEIEEIEEGQGTRTWHPHDTYTHTPPSHTQPHTCCRNRHTPRAINLWPAKATTQTNLILDSSVIPFIYSQIESSHPVGTKSSSARAVA